MRPKLKVRQGGGARRGMLVKRAPRGPLAPGVYVSGSDQPFYPQLLAMIARGQAALAGERYMRGKGGLVKYTTASVGRQAAVAANPFMAMSHDWFVVAMKEYHDWKLAWWREAVQNSVDAGATEIKLDSVQLPDGTWRITSTDNGRGMDEVILVTRFLALGGSDKRGPDGKAIGGFGKAKELLVLPWIEWTIHTGDTIVKGVGNHYEVSKAPFFHKGVILTVLMASDQYTHEAAAIEFLKRSYIPHVKFLVNGNMIKADLKPGELIDEVPDKLSIYYQKPKRGSDETSALIYVRINGMFMFHDWIDRHPGQIIAEITGKPIEMLQASRDKFRDRDAERALKNLTIRVAKDTMSALKSKKGLLRKKFEGTGKFIAQQKEAAALESMSSVVPNARGGLDAGDVRALVTAMDDVARRHSEIDSDFVPVQSLIESVNFRGPAHVESAIKLLSWQPDFFVLNEIEGFKVPKKFMPDSMIPTIRRLAKVWTELCRYVLIQLGCELPFGVGWTFSESMMAAYQPGNEEDRYTFKRGGEHWLLLNPFKHRNDRSTIWRPTDKQDLKTLYAIAIHEATHMADGISYHDESFASAYTMNVGKCADGFTKIRRIVSAIRLRHGIQADVRDRDDDQD